MALRKIIELEGKAFIQTDAGVVELGPQKTAFTAYCKITSISGNKEKGLVMVDCGDEKYHVIKQVTVPFSVDDNAPNFIKQAYLHLKTLPEWADATDC